MQDLVVLPVPKQGFVTGFGSPIPQHRLENYLTCDKVKGLLSGMCIRSFGDKGMTHQAATKGM